MQSEEEPKNIIELNPKPNTSEEPKEEVKTKNPESEFDFSKLIKKNADSKNKVQEERSKSNKGVIRNYRLK